MSLEHTVELTEEDLGLRPVAEHTKVAFGVLRVAALLSDELDGDLQRSAGVGLSEALVVIQIILAGGRLKMADLADTVVVTRGGVTKIVDRLVKAGYLDRVPSEEDRRVVYATVTDRGFEMVRNHQDGFQEITRRRIAEMLTSDELATMHALIDRLSCENPGWEPPQPEIPAG